MPSISLGSTIAELDNRKRDEDSDRPMCAVVSTWDHSFSTGLVAEVGAGSGLGDGGRE